MTGALIPFMTQQPPSPAAAAATRGFDNAEWSADYEDILRNIHYNCLLLHNYHRDEYIVLNKYLKYFRIPTIVFSAVNVFASVGLQPFIRQEIVSLVTCGISLVTGIINSIELFLNVYTRMQNEAADSKEYYLLAIDIYKTLRLAPANRPLDGQSYLQQVYSTYCKLVENSQVCGTLAITDKLMFLSLIHI